MSLTINNPYIYTKLSISHHNTTIKKRQQKSPRFSPTWLWLFLPFLFHSARTPFRERERPKMLYHPKHPRTRSYLYYNCIFQARRDRQSIIQSVRHIYINLLFISSSLSSYTIILCADHHHHQAGRIEMKRWDEIQAVFK